jgi:hypothetical protein
MGDTAKPQTTVFQSFHVDGTAQGGPPLGSTILLRAGALRRTGPDSAKQDALRSLGEEGLFATSPQGAKEPNRDASVRYV